MQCQRIPLSFQSTEIPLLRWDVPLSTFVSVGSALTARRCWALFVKLRETVWRIALTNPGRFCTTNPHAKTKSMVFWPFYVPWQPLFWGRVCTSLIRRVKTIYLVLKWGLVEPGEALMIEQACDHQPLRSAQIDSFRFLDSPCEQVGSDLLTRWIQRLRLYPYNGWG